MPGSLMGFLPTNATGLLVTQLCCWAGGVGGGVGGLCRALYSCPQNGAFPQRALQVKTGK